jgi:tetratricopeptide (TPR) repeat protein
MNAVSGTNSNLAKVLFAPASILALTLAASPASAGLSYGGCLTTAQPSVCIVDKAMDGAAALPWTERMADLVESGDVKGAVKLAGVVRPVSNLLSDEHARPSDTDLIALDAIDPDGARMLRDYAASDLTWERQIASHAAELRSRTLPPDAVAGFALAAAAYRAADPFADPDVQAALAKVPKDSPKDDAQVLTIAMHAIRPENRPYAVTPAGARAVLDHAEAIAAPSGDFNAALARFAWWAGDDKAARAALDRLKTEPDAAARHWDADARIWAALGQPAEAQKLVDARGEGRDKVLAEIAIGDGWAREGDRAHAVAAAHAALADGGDDPSAWIEGPALLFRAGAHEEAVSTAQALAARAEAIDPALRSTALATASQALMGIGESDEACRVARRSLALADTSAAAQVVAWKQHLYATEIPLNPWLGVDRSGDPAPVEDVRAAFRERAAGALESCGAAAEAAKALSGAKADPGGWRALVPVQDESLTPAERLKTATVQALATPGLAGRLADAAAKAPEPEDPVEKLMWRDAQAYALAGAGRADAARAMAASAVRGLDELGNPDDRQAVALVLARDHLALEALASGRAGFGRRLPD